MLADDSRASPRIQLVLQVLEGIRNLFGSLRNRPGGPRTACYGRCRLAVLPWGITIRELFKELLAPLRSDVGQAAPQVHFNGTLGCSQLLSAVEHHEIASTLVKPP